MCTDLPRDGVDLHHLVGTLVLPVVQGALSIMLCLGILVCQQGLPALTSIFPVVSGWLWLALSVCALALLLSSLAPEPRRIIEAETVRGHHAVGQ